jgi:hypothetical protein
MKIISFFLALLAFATLLSCSGGGKDENSSLTDSTKTDSASVLTAQSVILDDLLKVGSEKELIDIFGEDNVGYDTIWGAEGMFTMGSFLFPGTHNEVQIMWEDSSNRKKIISVGIQVKYDPKKDSYVLNNKWKTKDGITLGTSLEELIKLNGGKEITFYGLGWDYGGMVVSFNNGTLPGNLGLTLGSKDESLWNGEKSAVLVGDQEVNSSDPATQGVKIEVWEVFVH